jgi:hypothetical protein
MYMRVVFLRDVAGNTPSSNERDGVESHWLLKRSWRTATTGLIFHALS